MFLLMREGQKMSKAKSKKQKAKKNLDSKSLEKIAGGDNPLYDGLTGKNASHDPGSSKKCTGHTKGYDDAGNKVDW
jgi:hypothetical protein